MLHSGRGTVSEWEKLRTVKRIILFHIPFLCVVQWTDKKLYNETLKKLAGLFQKNFEVYTDYKAGNHLKLTEEILAAGPQLPKDL
jgi:hypothetical protein